MVGPRNPTSVSSMMRAMLRWEDAEGKRLSLYLREGDTAQIGRVSDNNVVLNSVGISRRHAVVTWREGAFEVKDLGSTNGTRVNGEPVNQLRVLEDGDVIGLHQVKLQFFELGQAEPELENNLEIEQTFVVLSDTAQPRLTISAGAQEGREIILKPGIMVIGRDSSKESWDIALQDRSVSRPHAQIEQQNNSFVLTDLGSANSTLVNGQIIAEPIVMQDGDVIEFGDTTLLFRER